MQFSVIIGITNILFVANGCVRRCPVSLWRSAVRASQRVLAFPNQEYIRA